MAEVDSSVYVAKPELLRMVDGKAWCQELHKSLRQEAKRATAITVLMGYWNAKYLLDLLDCVPDRPASRRRTCRVRIGVGLEPFKPIAGEWERLRELKTSIRCKGFGEVEVHAIRSGDTHFHTKLYGFVRTTQPTWYVGSANATDQRHELMVRVTRRHEGLMAYAKAAFDKGSEVDGKEPPDEVRTLQAFFSTGFLIHKPQPSNLLTFDAFRLAPEERRKIDRGDGQSRVVRHAAIETKGYGFRVAQAVGEGELQRVDEEGTSRMPHKHSSVETVFGHWAPAPYANELKAALEGARGAREMRLQHLADRLGSSTGHARAAAAFSDYAKDLNAILAASGSRPRDPGDLERSFERFVTSRIRLLSDDARRARLCRTLIVTPMPDIWHDEEASDEFTASFFEDVWTRATGSAKRGRVIRSIVKEAGGAAAFGLAEDLRDAFASRLEHRPWTGDEWLGASE